MRSTPVAEPKSGLSIEQLEEAIKQHQKSITELNSQLTSLSERINRQTVRRQEIRSQLADHESRRNELMSRLDELQRSDPGLKTDVARLGWQARLALLERERDAGAAELDRLDAEERTGLLRLQRDWANDQVQREQSIVSQLQTQLARRRQGMAEQAAQTAQAQQQAIMARNPVLAPAFEKNTQLAERLKQTEARAAELKQKLDQIHQSAQAVARQFQDTRMKVQALGLSSSVGAMLRKRKEDLPSLRTVQLDLETIRQEINRVQLEIFENNQELDELSTDRIHDEIVEAALRDVVPQREGAMRREIDQKLVQARKTLEALVVARRKRLTELNHALDRLGETLWDAELAETELIEVTNGFLGFINERILWIRSNDLLFSQLTIDPPDRALLDRKQWMDLGRRVVDVVTGQPMLFILLGLLVTVSMVARPVLQLRIDELGKRASRPSNDTFWPTAKALFLTILNTVSLPLLPLVVGGMIVWGEASHPSPRFHAFGQALLTVAWYWIPLEFVRRMCRPSGLGDAHFGWNDRAVRLLRNQLRWLIPLGIPIVFGVTLLLRLDRKHEVDLIERTLFVLGMLVVSVFLYRVFHPRQGVFSDYLFQHERSWGNQLSTLWFGGLVLLPLGLAALTVLGYYYTALHLTDCLYGTMVFAVVVETIRAMLARFILLGRRRRHIQAHQKLREAKLHQRASSQGDRAAEMPPVSDESIDMEKIEIDQGARHAAKFVSLSFTVVWVVGMWLIWTDVMPALKALDNYTLWPTQIALSDASAGSAGGTADREGGDGTSATTESGFEVVQKVTVRALLIFLIIVVITVVSARNLPSALEMFFLEQLPFDRTMRYAIKSLLGYGIVLIGTVLAFRALSISWSSVQWLVTALTFGLAFGLQEIFANFVAGIILMFERPMRLGDWITVGEFTGAVTRIRTRATTITTLDRKEYVVPNKDFITGRLVNWTLSDALNRVDVKVGVAYGTDIELARRLLLEVARKNHLLTQTPAPSVTFDQFGDNALNLTLRAFLPSVENRILATDQLHTEVNRAFAEAGIEISYPQRDLHLRSIDPQVAKALRGSNRSRN